MFFCINAIDNWLDGFDSYGGDKPLEESFDALGEEFSAFAKQLEGTPKILFKLSLPQTGRFNDYFKIEKTKMKELNGDRYSASTHRLAWCFLRIVMILTALRMMDSGVVTERVECADVDFETTMEIIKVISAHNDYIFNVLDRERPEGIAVANSYSAATRKTILAALPGYFKTEDMNDIAALAPIPFGLIEWALQSAHFIIWPKMCNLAGQKQKLIMDQQGFEDYTHFAYGHKT